MELEAVDGMEDAQMDDEREGVIDAKAQPPEPEVDGAEAFDPPPPPPDQVCERRPKARGIDKVRAAMRVAPNPRKPSKREIEEHVICHIPYASWCACCVGGRALDDAHKSYVDEHPTYFPIVSMDWCFLGQEADPETIPTLVVRDSQTGSTFARGTPGKAVNSD